MKVTLLKSHMTSRGGLEKITVGLAQAFARRGARVTLLTTGCSSPLPGIDRVINLGYRRRCTLLHHFSFDRACQAWLAKHPQDIVFGLDRNSQQSHYRAGNGVHAVYLQRRRLLSSAWQRFLLSCNPLHYFLCRRERALFTSPMLRTLFVNSTMVKQELISTYQIAPKSIIVVPNGVDWAATQQHFVPHRGPRPFTFLFVGNDYVRKGLPLILRALPFLSSYTFKLLVIGKSKPIAGLSSFPQVELIGAVPSLTPYYQQADALLLPSLYDPCANVTLEALAMGLYVISSPYNGAAEHLLPHTGAVLEDIRDPIAMATAMRYAMARLHDRVAIRHSVSHLDFSQQLDKIVSLTLQSALP